MAAGRSDGVGALIGASAALLATCVFGFLSLAAGDDPEAGAILQLGFFAGAILTLGSGVLYFVLSRRSGVPRTRFERLLEQRKAALGAIPAGILAVAVGGLWFAAKASGWGSGAPASLGGADQAVRSIDVPAIGAFLGFGAVFLVLSIVLAIRFERAAIRVAREEAEVGG